MKKLKILISLFAALLLLATCQKELPELDAKLDKSQVKYQVTQDFQIDEGGNTVILKNETQGVIPMWDFVIGRSNRMTDTVRFAFKGTYKIQFSVATGGGIVKCDSIMIEVTEDNLSYVSDPLWIALSGGVDKEKIWLLDIDSKFFDGPLFFCGLDIGWNWEKLGPDNWDWKPSYKDNTWLMPSGDYGTMTFNLKGGPYVKVEHKMVTGRGIENGTYFLDVNTKTLSMTDATPLHDQGRDACVGAWGSIKILSLTESAMQLAVLRTACEGPCLLVYNYISKEYSDNWIPPITKPVCTIQGEYSETNDNWTFLAGDSAKAWVLKSSSPIGWASFVFNTCDGAWNFMPDVSEPISWGMSAFSDTMLYKNELIFNKKNKTCTREMKGTNPETITGICMAYFKERGIWIDSGIVPISSGVNVKSWKNCTIYSLKADLLQLAVQSADKDEFVVFTYVPK